jgi:LPXTG-motif cell wall-anchored protein
VLDGSADWGVRDTFRSYVTGPIAQGSISPANGVTENAGGDFRWPVETFSDVDFATLDLTGITPTQSGSTHTWTDVPTTLTADGSIAFSEFYAEGTSLDPITVRLVLDDGSPPSSESSTTTDSSTSSTTSTSTSTSTSVPEPPDGAGDPPAAVEGASQSQPTTAVARGSLPATGADSMRLVALATALLAAGTALVVGGRRRAR